MAKRKHLSTNAFASMKGEYLKQCDDSIRIAKSTVREAKVRFRRLGKAIELHEVKIQKLQEKRKEILNLK